MPKRPCRMLLCLLALAGGLAAPGAARASDPVPGAAPALRWKGPVYYSLGMMGVGLVGLVATRQADDDPRWSNFESAFEGGPRRDDDGVLYNFVLHPLWGSETYLRAREAEFGMLGSFGFSLGASVTWEYLFESWTEHPSSQDLVLTTGIGWMLGELRYQLKQRTSEDAHKWIDPIHEALEHWGLGVEEDESGGKQPVVRFSYRF